MRARWSAGTAGAPSWCPQRGRSADDFSLFSLFRASLSQGGNLSKSSTVNEQQAHRAYLQSDHTVTSTYHTQFLHFLTSGGSGGPSLAGAVVAAASAGWTTARQRCAWACIACQQLFGFPGRNMVRTTSKTAKASNGQGGAVACVPCLQRLQHTGAEVEIPEVVQSILQTSTALHSGPRRFDKQCQAQSSHHDSRQCDHATRSQTV